MNCPDCKGSDVRVIDTLKAEAINTRRLACQQCGVRWQTDETIRRGSIQKRVTPIRTPSLAIRPPPLATGAPPVAANGDGGVGGGLSSGQVLSPILSGVLEAKSSEVVSKRRTKENYPQEFELIWAHTGRSGLKGHALRAWRKQGCPSLDAIRGPWSAYLASDRPQAGYLFNLSTWLNGDGHKQDWQPAQLRSGGRPAVARIEPPMCEPHRSGRLRPWQLPGSAVGIDPKCTHCAEAKHKQAKRTDREGEPETLATLLEARR